MTALQPEPAQFDALVRRVRDSRLPSPTVRREIRERAGVSVREAAAANGVSPMSYLRWERGQVQPRRAHAIRLRQFLDALDEVAS
jgi:DNA-binding XRE family transcriptional regulator